MTVALRSSAAGTKAWMTNASGWVLGLFIVLCVAAILGSGFVPSIGMRDQWLLTLGLMALILVAIGVSGDGRAWGTLIDDRNRFSLSRLQLVLWTLIGLSAFFAIALRRLATDGVADPMAISIPQELWWLMGISTTTFIGTPLLRSYKSTPTREPLPEERAETLQQLGVRNAARGQPQPETSGLIVKNVSAKGARWTDLFMGEETGNATKPDMGKIQMFYFTIILVLTYVLALMRTFKDPTLPSALPAISASMIALLGISHAGYLANKAVPHSTEAP